MYIFVFAFLISSALARTIDDTKCPPFTPPGPGFDLSKYLGFWYEIARNDVPYEKGLDCVNATYTLREDKNVTVLNQGKNLQTKVVSVLQGVGRVTQQANLLEVRFDPRTPEAPYWIVDTDFYTYSVVYSCADVGKYVYRGAYILSRFPVMSDSLREKLTDKLVDLGIKREDLRKTEQLKCLLP